MQIKEQAVAKTGPWNKLVDSLSRRPNFTVFLTILMALLGIQSVAAQDTVETQPALPIPGMPANRDTTPGLLPYTNEIPLHSATDVANLLDKIWQDYDLTNNDPEQLAILRANFMLEQIFTGEPTYGPRTDLRIEQLGLGFPREITYLFPYLDRVGHSLFTAESLAQADREFAVKQLVFAGNPAADGPKNGHVANLFAGDPNRAYGFQVFDGYDNVAEVTFAHALGALRWVKVGNESLWERLTPAERTAWAAELTTAWIAQRVDGPALWEQRSVNYWDGQKNVPLFVLQSGEGGWLTCRVEAAANNNERVNQGLTTRRVLIQEQDDGTNLETPFNQLSRNGHFAVAITLDINTLNQVAQRTNGNLEAIKRAILQNAGAFEIIDLDTGFNHPASPQNTQMRNVVPTMYEVGGLTYGEQDLELGDFTFLMRPCGPAVTTEPALTSTPAAPAVTNNAAPAVETTPSDIPPSTPEVTPPPPGEKNGLGNNNPDGADHLPTEAPSDDTNSDEANDSPL